MRFSPGLVSPASRPSAGRPHTAVQPLDPEASASPAQAVAVALGTGGGTGALLCVSGHLSHVFMHMRVCVWVCMWGCVCVHFFCIVSVCLSVHASAGVCV